MATLTAQKCKHATLVASTADTVTLSGCESGIIRVRNRATSGAPLYFFVYPLSAPTKTACTAAADESYVVPFGDLTDVQWGGGTVVLSVVSADAQAYSVESLRGLN